MNWMLIIVVIIFLFAIFRGWRRGFLKILFSLVSIIVLIWLFSKLNPYISSFLKDHTGLYARIEARCAETMEDRLGSGLGFLANSTADVAADWILKGMSFLITLIVALLIVFIIFRVIGLINRVPVVKGINRFFGLIAGGVEGYLVICLLMLLVSLFAGSELGGTLLENINSNAFLSFLYDHNFLFQMQIFQ